MAYALTAAQKQEFAGFQWDAADEWTMVTDELEPLVAEQLLEGTTCDGPEFD